MFDASEYDAPLRRFAALSHPTRLTVFRQVMHAGREGVAAGALADAAGVSPSNLSAHLSILTEADLVTVRADGRRRIFAPNLERVADVVRFLVQDCCNGHPEVCAALPKADDFRT